MSPQHTITTQTGRHTRSKVRNFFSTFFNSVLGACRNVQFIPSLQQLWPNNTWKECILNKAVRPSQWCRFPFRHLALCNLQGKAIHVMNIVPYCKTAKLHHSSHLWMCLCRIIDQRGRYCGLFHRFCLPLHWAGWGYRKHWLQSYNTLPMPSSADDSIQQPVWLTRKCLSPHPRAPVGCPSL